MYLISFKNSIGVTFFLDISQSSFFNCKSDSIDSLEERTRQLFANARKVKSEQRDQEFEKIRQVSIVILAF